MDRKHAIIIAGAVAAAIVLIAVLMTGGAGKPAAIVNGQPITEAELQRAISSRAAMHEGTGANVTSKALRASVLEQLISEVLLLQGAVEAGITVTDEEVKQEMDKIRTRSGSDAFNKFLKRNSITEQQYSAKLRERLLKDRFVDGVIFNGGIPEEDLREFYSQSPVPFLAPESVEIRIVEFATEAEAREAVEAMRAEKDGFDRVADRLKDGNTAFVSEYGDTSPSYYPGEVGRAMKELAEGEFGGPYAGKDGYFIIRVKKRLPERPRTFEEAREEIRAMLYDRRRSAALIHWVADKKNSSTIVRN